MQLLNHVLRLSAQIYSPTFYDDYEVYSKASVRIPGIAVGVRMTPEVLIVEDSLDDCELMTRALMAADSTMRVEACSTPSEALSRLFDEEAALPKVVLLDLELRAELDGHDVLREIRANERTKFLPVVVLTGHQDQQKAGQSYHLGANSHIVKPTQATELSEMIGRVGKYWTRVNSSLATGEVQ